MANERHFCADRATDVSVTLLQSCIVHAVTMRHDPNDLGMGYSMSASMADALALKKACGEAMIAATADRPGDAEFTAADGRRQFEAGLRVVADYLAK
jgi:hypothetical protein